MMCKTNLHDSNYCDKVFNSQAARQAGQRHAAGQTQGRETDSDTAAGQTQGRETDRDTAAARLVWSSSQSQKDQGQCPLPSQAHCQFMECMFGATLCHFNDCCWATELKKVMYSRSHTQTVTYTNRTIRQFSRPVTQIDKLVYIFVPNQMARCQWVWWLGGVEWEGGRSLIY